ncbi:hypothetical protein, partial [Streptococcus gordonii]
ARELDSAEAGERLAQEAEDYLKTHDMAVRENLSIKPELEEAFARQAENAANLERELVGAGARASAESGQAFAQHGDDVARGLEAVSGGAASRVSREFSSQASESLAKHGDDVSRGLRHTGGGGRAGSEFASEAGEAFARHGDDVAKGSKVTEEFVDGKFTDPEVQARYEKYLERKAKAGEVPRDPMDWKEASEHMAKIREQGYKFEVEKLDDFKKVADNVEDQITIKVTTPDGEEVKIRVDAMGYDKETGALRIQEYKSSETAPFTQNQNLAYPHFEQTGGVVVGEGKGIFKGGFEIPPGTKIEVIRPSIE